MSKVDIIIPAFNAHKTIVKTLGSIAAQTSSDECQVIIINDAGENYQHIVNQFSSLLKIKEIQMIENGGPGAARQIGIESGKSPYLMFIDADDTFYGAYGLEIFLKTAELYPKFKMINSPFFEEIKNEANPIIERANNMVWVFGKMYNRRFIELNNIRFNNTRSNEDTGFNTLFELCLPNIDEEEIVNLGDIFYCWHHNENSITRANNYEYSYNQNLPGYVENMIYAIKGAEARNPFNDKINYKRIETMVSLYYLYCRLVAINPDNKKQYIMSCVKYYNEILKNYERTANKEEFNKVLISTSDIRLQNMRGILPELTLVQFLTAVKGASYNGEIN